MKDNEKINYEKSLEVSIPIKAINDLLPLLDLDYLKECL